MTTWGGEKCVIMAIVTFPMMERWFPMQEERSHRESFPPECSISNILRPCCCLVLFLVVLVIGLHLPGSSFAARKPQFALQASKYKVSIWVARPLWKRTPTQKELESESQWRLLANLEDSGPFKTSADLLQRLRQRNPALTFARFEYEFTKELAPDEVWDLNFFSSNLSLRVCHKDRQAYLEKILRGIADERIKDEYTNQRLVMPLKFVTTYGQSSNRRVRTTRDEYCAIRPNVIYYINPDIQYNISEAKKSGGAKSPVKAVVRQLPTDVVLFTIRPLP